MLNIRFCSFPSLSLSSPTRILLPVGVAVLESHCGLSKAVGPLIRSETERLPVQKNMLLVPT